MNNQSPFKLTPLAAAVAAVLYPTGPAIAQDETNDAVLEEVLVTATLRSTSLQVVPQSITAFTGADIERNNIQNLEDAVRALPSLGLVASRPGRNDVVFRGLSSGSGEYYTDSQVAVYIDDVPMSLNSQQPFPHFVDIERLESLPGPQGTLFGSASQSGTLRIITNKPNTEAMSGEVFAEIATTKGGDPSYEVNGWVNIPMGDSFAIRAVGYYVDHGGYIDNVYHETFVQPVPGGPQFPGNNEALVEDNFNKYSLVGGRIAALWEINDDWSALLSVISESSKTDGTWASDPSLGDFKIAKFHNEQRDDEWTNFGLTIQGDLGFATLTSATNFFEREIFYEWDNMYYEQYKDRYWGVYLGYDLYNTEYSYGITFNDPQKQERFAQEFRLVSQSESRFQWMAGLYYEDLHDDWFYGSTNPWLQETVAWEYAQYLAYYYNYYGYPVDYPLQPTTLAYTNELDRDTKQKSVFGEISFDITDKWKVTGGARWFEYKRNYWEQNFFPAGLAPLGSVDIEGIIEVQSKSSDTMFKFSTQYQIDENKMIYALFSQGFRLGGNNNPRAVERSDGDVPATYKPDIVDNYEIGLKSEWLDNRFLFNATFYRMEWNNYQQTGGTGAWWLQGWFNATDARIQGVEFQGTLLVTDNFSFNYSAIFSDPKWLDNYEFPGGQTIVKGMTLPTSPKRKFFLAADYTVPGLFGTKDVFFHYDISYQSETWNQLSAITDGDEEGIIEAWDVSNFRMGAHLENDWTISLVVRNVFDQKAISSLDSGFQRYVSDLFETDFNRDKRTYNRPRTIGLQIRKGFN